MRGKKQEMPKYSVSIINETTEEEKSYSGNFILIALDKDGNCDTAAVLESNQAGTMVVFQSLNALWQRIGSEIAMKERDTKSLFIIVLAAEALRQALQPADPSVWRVD